MSPFNGLSFQLSRDLENFGGLRCWSLFPRRRCSKFPPSVSARYMYVSDVCALYIAYFLTRSLNAFIVVEFMYIHTYIHKIHQICNLDIFHSKYTYLHKFICQCAHVPSTYMRSYNVNPISHFRSPATAVDSVSFLSSLLCRL